MRRDVFQALADPNRRAIISLLATQKLTVKAVAGHFPISRPAVSRHVKILAECGLITVRRKGRERFCEVQLDKLNEVSTWIEQQRKTWEGRLDRLDEYLSELKAKERK
ncbi:MAG TPA: metalloregulator ArsR/SmtB family transcription factor [Anaerolineales bacterium]|nr:metalloregulator ArsR/SmtB family transcription factor [Anaerolineales bacterium]